MDDNFEFNPETYFTNLKERVEKIISSSLGQYEVLSIEPANASKHIHERFVETWKKLTKESANKQVAPVLCFHGTAGHNIPSIVRLLP